MDPTQRVVWPCVVVATFRFPNAHPPGPETWVPAARETMLSVLIALLTMAAMAGGILTFAR